MARFHSANFSGYTEFWGVEFALDNECDQKFMNTCHNFGHSSFQGPARFDEVIFRGNVNFGWAHFESDVSFEDAIFYEEANFVGTKFDSVADFSSVLFTDIHFGGNDENTIDLRFAIPLPDAQIVLSGNSHLLIHPDKIKYLKLSKYLSWDEKYATIEELKSRTFPNDNEAKNELDYLFRKSTMHQDYYSDIFSDPQWYLAKYWINNVYYITMGFGYRPFRIFIWAAIMIVIFGIIYLYKMPEKIYQFILMEHKVDKRRVKKTPQLPLANCLYFSVMIFFTFRLNRLVLTFFSKNEQVLILTQWVLGFIVYLSFILFSKKGSVLAAVKDLFVY